MGSFIANVEINTAYGLKAIILIREQGLYDPETPCIAFEDIPESIKKALRDWVR